MFGGLGGGGGRLLGVGGGCGDFGGGGLGNTGTGLRYVFLAQTQVISA